MLHPTSPGLGELVGGHQVVTRVFPFVAPGCREQGVPGYKIPDYPVAITQGDLRVLVCS